MKVELWELQRPDHVGQGRITGADGRGSARRGTRTSAARAEHLSWTAGIWESEDDVELLVLEGHG